MVKNNMSFLIGGDAGQGVESSGAGFAKALARGGLHVFGLQDYHSRIRGGHNFYQVRVNERSVFSHTEAVHLLLALTEETIHKHQRDLVAGSGIVFDEEVEVPKSELEKRGVKLFPVPMSKMAKEHGGAEVMRNTAVIGAAAGLTEYEFDRIADVIEDNFQKKGGAVVENNLKVARAAYRFARENYAPDFDYKVEPVDGPRRMVINGNQAFCLGAVLSGCKFVAGYPMTPATSVLEWMSTHAQRLGVVTKHTEDEIAAVCMAIGAAHAGVRAMAPTSGGGFSLMVEGLGLAAMTETPVVILEAQRPGPSTGFATRTEQGDLQFILHASQGEFPRIVLAPGTVEQCFQAGARAFNLAEKYQCPVIILSDNYLANSLRTIDREDFNFSQVEIDRGTFLFDQDLDGLSGEYKRYRFTDSGISPRAVPGHPRAVYATSSDEHDEFGHIAEDADNRIKMMDKRMRKLQAAAEEMGEPELYGPEEADLTFISWGSTYGPLREVVDTLNQKGSRANLLAIMDIWPFPTARVAEVLDRAKRTIGVESNYSGQMAELIRVCTGREVTEKILRYDGRPISPEYILTRLNGGG
ncbi:MAG: 2-oxoacid:acceptor oxidoreductase subunit alpha [bacterium]